MLSVPSVCDTLLLSSPQGYSCDKKDSCSFKTYPSVFKSKFKHYTLNIRVPKSSSNGLHWFIALRAKSCNCSDGNDYASRTACLLKRIAICYHQNSKNESLPSGCLSGLCLSLQAIYILRLYPLCINSALIFILKSATYRV